MRTRALPVLLAVVGATLASMLAAATPAHADHPRWWWEDDDPAAWTGAGAGWNGSAWRDTRGGGGGGSGGGGGGTATWTPADTRTVEVRRLTVDRAAISPNGDEHGDDTHVTFELRRRSGPVSVRVVDATGATVRQLGELRETGRTGRFTWDGTDARGVVVADGTYRIVLAKLESSSARTERADPLAIEVVVDTRSPQLAARRPTLVQLRSLSKRAGQLRDARRRWEAKLAQRGTRSGTRRHKGTRGVLGDRERDWVRLWESRQLRLPVRFTTVEDGEVEVTARVGAKISTLRTWRAAGSHRVDLVLPTYTGGARLRMTFATEDAASNVRRHTVVATLPALPKPRPTRRSAERPTSAAPVTGVPTSGGGPFPDWLDPIMLRATYAAGVPQSWARSTALANLVFRESSYRPTAKNPTSTAYGLFQFLDQTWATVGCRRTSDAYQQSVCGLRYVQRRYGTPERAWAFWQANHWY